MSELAPDEATLYRTPRVPLTPLVRAGLVALPVSLLVFVGTGFTPDLVEAAYSRGLYPRIASLLAGISERFDPSFADISIVVVALLLVGAPISGYRRARRMRGSGGQAALHGALFFLATAAWIWTAFLLVWGLNYRREPAEALFGLEAPVSEPHRAELERLVGGRVDAAREGVMEDHRGVVLVHDDLEQLDRRIRPLVDAVLADAGLPVVERGRAKAPLFVGALALRGGSSGGYSLFTGEPNVVLPAAPGTLPFVIAHERAHLAGIAHEDAASFVALVALWRSREPELRYAAWLALWRHLGQPADERVPGVRRDVEAIRAFWSEHLGPESTVFRGAYDAYLRGHGVRDGAASYGRVVSLAFRWMEKNGVPRVPGPPSELTSHGTSVTGGGR